MADIETLIAGRVIDLEFGIYDRWRRIKDWFRRLRKLRALA